MSRVLLTGATGFLGMEVLVRLLERTDREVLCLVRAADIEAAEARLDRVLGTLYRDATPYRSRVKALLGDVTSPVGTPVEAVDVVCHCAASISFDLQLEEAREINVEGTRAMLALARATGARRFVHVSTAYVGGTYEGAFGEEMLDAGQGFRNTYEQTKFEAEHLVGAITDMDVAIARPSIVMGESDSGWTPAFNVLYWPLRAFARGLFEQVPARPEGRVDVVPVDYVADGIARLIEGDETGTFNLVSGADASTVDELSDLACTHFGRPRPPYVQTGASSGSGVDEHGAVYVPYFDMDIVFDDTRTRELLGLRAPRMRSYFDALMDYADLAKWGKRGTTREEARQGITVSAQ
jgi:long-chain acyl-CoA synthetase